MKHKMIALALFGLSQSALAAPLPSQAVGPFEFKNKPVVEALHDLFASTGIQLVPNNLPNIIVSASGVQGDLPVVMDSLAEYAGLTYMYNDNMIVVSQAKNSNVKIPEVKAPVSTPVAAAPVAVAAVSPTQVVPVDISKEKPVQAPVVAAAVKPVSASQVAQAETVKPPVTTSAVESKPEVKTVIVDESVGKPLPTVVTDSKPAIALKRKPIEPVKTAALVDAPVTQVQPVENAPKSEIVKTYTLRLTQGSGVKRLMEANAKENGYALNWEGDDLYVKYSSNYVEFTYEALLNQVLSSIKVNGYMTNNATNGKVIYVINK